MSIVTDPNDPRIRRGGPDQEPTAQHEVYLALSAEEIAKGFVRPVRKSYTHVGPSKPQFALRDVDADELKRFDGLGYVKYEAYPPGQAATGRYWTQKQLDATGCGRDTAMADRLAETYARNPKFYGATYCVNCAKHLAVDEFVWTGTRERVGS